MKRRGFLSALGVSALAGPGMAKEAILNVSTASGASTLGLVGSGRPMQSNPDFVDWRIQEVIDLKRRLSGELSEEERLHSEASRLHDRRRVAEYHVSALRSVSQAHGMRMYAAECKRLDGLQERMTLTARLIGYAKQGFK